MTYKKTIFIIPGFKHKPSQKAYKAIAKMLKKEGYYPIPISIPWRKTTISQNTEYFLKEYNKIQRKKKYILGFSLGAMIAFVASTKIKTSGLILCSLSPFFEEDLKKVQIRYLSKIKKEYYQDFSGLQCKALAKQIKSKKILMLYGARESKVLIKRVRKAYAQINSTRKYLIPIQHTEHNIGDKRYLYTIHQIAKQLN